MWRSCFLTCRYGFLGTWECDPYVPPCSHLLPPYRQQGNVFAPRVETFRFSRVGSTVWMPASTSPGLWGLADVLGPLWTSAAINKWGCVQGSCVRAKRVDDRSGCLVSTPVPDGEAAGFLWRKFALPKVSLCHSIQKLEEVYPRKQLGRALIAGHPVICLSFDHIQFCIF